MAIEGVAVTAVQLFGDHLAQFRQHLVDQHYADGTVNQYMRCIGVLAELMKLEKIVLDELDLARALALLAKTGWIHRRRTDAAFMVRRFIRFLTEQGVGKPPVPPTAEEIARAALKRDYQSYLSRQRGLGERTVFHAWRFADRFLRFRFGDASGDLSQITSADIVDFLQHLTTRTPPFSVRPRDAITIRPSHPSRRVQRAGFAVHP
jgi:integrase/recombinase XerD